MEKDLPKFISAMWHLRDRRLESIPLPIDTSTQNLTSW
jgi:hypothetical protein